MAHLSQEDKRFTVYLRFPFDRNGFEDPPIAEWNLVKEKKLWEHLSMYANKSDIRWEELAQMFNVSVPFILQQAAWLYEKELEQVRAQMQKVNFSKDRKRQSASPAAPTYMDRRSTRASPNGSPGYEFDSSSNELVEDRKASRGRRNYSSRITERQRMGSGAGNQLSTKNSDGSLQSSSKSSPASTSSFFGSNYGESSRQLLSKSRLLAQPMEEIEFDPDFLPLEYQRNDNDNDEDNGIQEPHSTERHPMSTASSSFTELSEASITKSALEEALLSDMGDASIRPGP